jgi:hypothetical protein
MTAQWSHDHKRRDGLAIVVSADGLIIAPAPGRGPAYTLCPCCGKRFAISAQGYRAARLVADMVFPIIEEAGDGAD